MNEVVTLLFLLGLSDVAFAAFRGSATWNGFKYHYYAGNGDEVSWCEANMACKTHYPGGFEIVNIQTANVNAVIENLLLQFEFPTTWLGGSYIYNHAWHWTDGSLMSFSYTDWCTGEPWESDIASCLVTQACWDNWNCNSRTGYICQQDLSNSSPELHYYADLKLIKMGDKTFRESKEECERIGAGIAKVTGESSKAVVQGNFYRETAHLNISDAKYWVDMDTTEDQCSVVSSAGFEEYDCNSKVSGFFCEIARPELQVSEEHPIVRKSESLKVHCVASGSAVQDVTWYKNEEPVTTQYIAKSSSTLVIKSATMSDAGRYFCVATSTIDGEPIKTIASSLLEVLPHEDD